MLPDPFDALRDPQPPLDLKPAHTGLLTIDVQYYNGHPEWGYGRIAREKGLDRELEPYYERVQGVVRNIRTLQDASRRSGVEVVHVRIATRSKDGRDLGRGTGRRGILVLKDSQEAEILDPVRPVGDELVLSKTTASAFTSTDIDRVLQNLGLTVLIACGLVTSGCVYLTVRDAADRGYRVLVVSDACTATTEDRHNYALALLEGPRVSVVSTAEVLALLHSAAMAAVAT